MRAAKARINEQKVSVKDKMSLSSGHNIYSSAIQPTLIPNTTVITSDRT